MKNLLDHLKGKDIWWGLLVFTLLGAIIYFGVVAFKTGKNLDSITVVITCLVFGFKELLQYRYGSSKGSKDKQDQLDKLKQGQ